jgi:hypothetical protein
MWTALLPHNEHQIDRGLRVFVGGILIYLAVAGYTAWGYLGVVPFVTGLAGSCPVYTLFGISTCSVRPPRAA